MMAKNVSWQCKTVEQIIPLSTVHIDSRNDLFTVTYGYCEKSVVYRLRFEWQSKVSLSWWKCCND